MCNVLLIELQKNRYFHHAVLNFFAANGMVCNIISICYSQTLEYTDSFGRERLELTKINLTPYFRGTNIKCQKFSLNFKHQVSFWPEDKSECRTIDTPQRHPKHTTHHMRLQSKATSIHLFGFIPNDMACWSEKRRYKEQRPFTIL